MESPYGEYSGEGTPENFAVMEVTHELGEYELQLIAAQDQLVAPARRFEAKELR